MLRKSRFRGAKFAEEDVFAKKTSNDLFLIYMFIVYNFIFLKIVYKLFIVFSLRFDFFLLKRHKALPVRWLVLARKETEI